MTSFGRPLRHARWQAVLAVAAIAAAVALPVVLVSVGGGVASHELASLENAGYQLVVSAAGLHGIEDAHNASLRLLGTPNITFAAPILSVPIDAFNATGQVAPVLGEGVIPCQFAPTLGPTQRGLFPLPLPLGDPNDTVHFADGTYRGTPTYSVLVSSTYAAKAHVGVGGTLLLSPTTNASQGVRYNVTGIFGVALSIVQPSGAFAVMLPLSDLQVLTGYAHGSGTVVPDGADTIEVVVDGAVARSSSALARVAAQVQALFPSYTVTTLSEEAQQLEAASAVLTGFYLALSSVGLIVGLVFLALILVRRVERERRAIGIRRAIGMPAGSIAVELVRSGAVLAVAGGLAGVGAGYVVVHALASWGSATVREAARLAIFDPAQLGALVLGVVALSALASSAAVRAANRVNVLEALR